MATPLAAGNHRQPTAGAMGLLVVGLAGLFSSLLIYSGTVISFLRFPLFDLAFGPAGYMALFAETTLLASTVLGAAIAMASLRKRRPLPFMVLGALAAVAYLCCSLGFGFACYFQVTIPEVYPLLGTAAAVADCGMVLVWGRVCARRLTMRPALVVVGLASVLSAAFCFLYSWLPLEGMLALFFVGSTLAAVIPLAVHDSRGGVEGDEGSAASASVAGRVAAVPADAADEAGEAGEADAPDARSRIASLFEVVGTPSLGLVSFAFVMAVMRTSFNESQSLYLAALALSGTGIVAYALLKRGRFLLPGGLQQTFLPVVALVVLAAANITATVGQGVAVSDWLTYGLYSLAAVLTLATLCAVAHAGEFSPDLVFAVAICAFCGASFIGQQVGGALPNDMVSVVVTITTTLYAFALVLVSHFWRKSAAPLAAEGGESDGGGRSVSVASAGEVPGAVEVGSPVAAVGAEGASGVSAVVAAGDTSSSDTLAARCARLAEAHSLTAREREILEYLAEGHNGSYIASVLFISPNTARTHIHNIYRKLGVSSREEILRLTRR